MNFLFTINENYIKPIQVLMKSIYCNNGAGHKFFFIHKSLDDSAKKTISSFASEKCFGEARFYLFPYEDDLFKTTGSWSKEIYFRLFSPFIITDADKVLYLDGDTIVNGNLNEVYNSLKTNEPIAAVKNDEQEMHKKRLGINTDYINSGVLLINLSYIRSKYTSDDIFAYLQENINRFQFWDQDFLNCFFGNNIHLLGSEYNYMINVAEKNKHYTKIKNPIIIHYVLTKPWEVYYEYRGDWAFIKYLFLADFRKEAVHLLYIHRVFWIKNRIKKTISSK